MRLARIALATVVLGGACHAQISDGGESHLDGTDAGATGNPSGDAMAPPVAQCTSRTVYLNFEGQTLTQGPSDAVLNQASWMTIAQGTAPPYLAGNTNRAAAIQNIVAGVTAQLSQFPITVVTARPRTGNYVMIVFGGQASQVGSRFGGAVNQLDCGDTRPNDVAWISDSVSPTQRVVNFAVGAIGFGLGLTGTLDPNDCMCGWDNQCTSNNTAACNLTSPINRDPSANQTCAGLTTQDEPAAFRQAFCQ
ncbi:MAG TPA: hypothetical protein VHN14_07615 [Kofleriaceae bacterium]|jgi:hypothetical protein|nr:hypothetical protein [Kofleriaceae bacterium]